MDTPKFKHKKSLGQHFLNNGRIPKKMADAADIRENDVVVEIGPGTGVLTRELLKRGAQVIALEADERAIAVLAETFESEIVAKKLVILHTDMRHFDVSSLELAPHAYKVVANIPYYLSGLLFRIFLDSTHQPSTLVFLVQKEVAERIARDKKESLLSLSVKAFGDPKYIETVKRGNFTPQPKVDSAIIAVQNIGDTRLTRDVAPFFFEVLHLGFQSRRKQLLGNLASSYEREALVHIFSTLGIPLAARGEDLSAEIWQKLVGALAVHRKISDYA